MTKMYKIKMYLINLGDELSEKEIKEIIESSVERNSLSMIIEFDDISHKDIGEWTDDIKFNFSDTNIEEYRKEFKINEKN